RRAFWLQARNQRTSLSNLGTQVAPFTLKGKNFESGFTQIAFHVRGVNSTRFCGVQFALNPDGFGTFILNREILASPIAQHHGKGRGTAAIFFLANIGNVEPQARGALHSRGPADQKYGCAQNELSSGKQRSLPPSG